jgi:hypothetical protein
MAAPDVHVTTELVTDRRGILRRPNGQIPRVTAIGDVHSFDLDSDRAEPGTPAADRLALLAEMTTATKIPDHRAAPVDPAGHASCAGTRVRHP